MALVVRNLVCGYGADLVVQGADFTLEPGHVVCVLGPNGIGKTTLFKAILGFLPYEQGTVEIDGHSLGSLSRNEIARALAYVPQTQNVPFSYTVEEFVLMGRAPHLRLLQQPASEDYAVVARVLKEMGIDHLAKKTCTEISGGELQLACVARALAQEPRYLVMDEPTASLDFGNQARVLRRVLELASMGIGILMTTHDPSQAFALDSDVVLLNRSKDSIYGPCGEVLTEQILTEMYGTEVMVRIFNHHGALVSCCAAVVQLGDFASHINKS